MSPDWFLYLIRCADRSLYTGITTDVDRRFAEHCAQGTLCAKYLRGRGPLALVFQMRVGTRAAAARLEVRVKRLSKAKKEAMVMGETSLEELGERSRDGFESVAQVTTQAAGTMLGSFPRTGQSRTDSVALEEIAEFDHADSGRRGQRSSMKQLMRAITILASPMISSSFPKSVIEMVFRYLK